MSTIVKLPVPVERVDSLAADIELLNGAIMARAYDYFLERGSVHGYDADDWLKAENDLTVKPGVEVRRDDHDYSVEMTLPAAEVSNLRIRIAANEMLVSSEPGSDRRRVFGIVHFPEPIDWAGADAEITENRLRVVLAIGTESETRSYVHFA